MKKMLCGALLALSLVGCGAPMQTVRLNVTQPQAYQARDINFVKESIKEVVRREFIQLDTDHDGRLSKEELGKKSPLFLVTFQTVDVNMDGYVTYEEFLDRMASNMEGVAGMLYAFMDTNNDGIVNNQDWSKIIVGLCDYNRDGVLSYDEFLKFLVSAGMINPPS
ncbi:MAG TPA: EF-hand domain-containing protein [Chroococcales cyanobacterium]